MRISDWSSDVCSSDVLGHDPRREPLTIKQHLGYLPDSVGFYGHLSALDNLAYNARLLGIPAARRRERIGEALERVQLTHVLHKRVAAFSHGMRPRLGLADIRIKQDIGKASWRE